MNRLRLPSQGKHRSLQDPYAMIDYLISSSLSVFALHSRLQIPENTLVRSSLNTSLSPLLGAIHFTLSSIDSSAFRENLLLWDKLILCMQKKGKS